MSGVTYSEGVLIASDGTRLYHQSWIPETPHAVVLVCHGLAEHSGRYANVVERLVPRGYAVHGVDHRGHGRSDGRRVYVRRYRELIDDFHLFRCHVQAAHPDLPVVLLGHSMGGNVALSYALDHGDGLVGLALSAPAVTVPADLSRRQLAVFRLLGRFLPRLRLRQLDSSTISRDPAVVAAYDADPLVYRGRISAGLGAALLGAIETLPARVGELRMPLCLMHGTDDRLVPVAGTHGLEAMAVNATVTARYYDGLYHEIFNEPEHGQVLDDLLAWLDDLTGKKPDAPAPTT